MPSLAALLKKREGYKTVVYKDPKKANMPTVGIGHLVQPADKLKLGDEIDDQRVMAFFKKDSANAVSRARSQAARAGIKDAQFIVYLASVNFQLGFKWPTKFKKTWALIMEGKYEDAAVEAQNSLWYKQTPVRVKDFQLALRALPDKTAGK
jgi:GH24 family phage-related lysozyme (muramidase)